MERLLTIRQLSELIQVSPKTIYQWVHIGYILHYKFLKGIRFREKDVEDRLNTNLSNAANRQIFFHEIRAEVGKKKELP